MYHNLPQVYYSTASSGYTPPHRLQPHSHPSPPHHLSHHSHLQPQYAVYHGQFESRGQQWASGGVIVDEEEEEEERRRLMAVKVQYAKLRRQRELYAESRRKVDSWINDQSASLNNNLLLPDSEPLIFYSTPFLSSTSSSSTSSTPISSSPMSASSFSSIPNAIISSAAHHFSSAESSPPGFFSCGGSSGGRRHARRMSSGGSSGDSNPRTRHSSLSSIPEEP